MITTEVYYKECSFKIHPLPSILHDPIRSIMELQNFRNHLVKLSFYRLEREGPGKGNYLAKVKQAETGTGLERSPPKECIITMLSNLKPLNCFCYLQNHAQLFQLAFKASPFAALNFQLYLSLLIKHYSVQNVRGYPQGFLLSLLPSPLLFLLSSLFCPLLSLLSSLSSALSPVLSFLSSPLFGKFLPLFISPRTNPIYMPSPTQRI